MDPLEDSFGTVLERSGEPLGARPEPSMEETHGHISPPWSRVAAGDGSGRLFLGFGEGLVMVFECLRGFWGARLEITMEERSE